MGAVIRTGDGREAISYLTVPLSAGVVLRLSGCGKSWMLVGATVDINGIQGTVDGASFCPLLAGQSYFSDDSEKEFTLWVVSTVAQTVSFQFTNGVVNVRPAPNLVYAAGVAVAPRAGAGGVPMLPVMFGQVGFNGALAASATNDLGALTMLTARDSVNYRIRLRCVVGGTISWQLRNTTQAQNFQSLPITMIAGEIIDIPLKPAFFDVSAFCAAGDVFALRFITDATATGQASGMLVRQS